MQLEATLVEFSTSNGPINHDGPPVEENQQVNQDSATKEGRA